MLPSTEKLARVEFARDSKEHCQFVTINVDSPSIIVLPSIFMDIIVRLCNTLYLLISWKNYVSVASPLIKKLIEVLPTTSVISSCIL